MSLLEGEYDEIGGSNAFQEALKDAREIKVQPKGVIESPVTNPGLLSTAYLPRGTVDAEGNFTLFAEEERKEQNKQTMDAQQRLALAMALNDPKYGDRPGLPDDLIQKIATTKAPFDPSEETLNRVFWRQKPISEGSGSEKRGDPIPKIVYGRRPKSRSGIYEGKIGVHDPLRTRDNDALFRRQKTSTVGTQTKVKLDGGKKRKTLRKKKRKNRTNTKNRTKRKKRLSLYKILKSIRNSKRGGGSKKKNQGKKSKNKKGKKKPEIKDMIEQKKYNVNITYLFMLKADWCGHCQSTAPIFNSAMKSINKNPMVKMGSLECSNLPESSRIKKELIQGFPTFLRVRNGREQIISPDRSHQGFLKALLNTADI